jgi:CBS domain-containing protein
MQGILDTPVSAVVTRGVVTVNETATLEAAARHLAARSVGAAVVVRGARSVGLLSERDIVERIGAGVDPRSYTAGDAMTAPLIVAEAHETVEEVLDRMAVVGIRHLPVVDVDGHLLGLVSLAELLGRLVATQTTIDLRPGQLEGASGWFG